MSSLTPFIFPQVTATSILSQASVNDPVDPLALDQAKAIVARVRSPPLADRSAALLQVAQDFGDVPKGQKNYIMKKEQLKEAYDGLTELERDTLDRTHARVKAFADMQRASVQDMTMDIPGGKLLIIRYIDR